MAQRSQLGFVGFALVFCNNIGLGQTKEDKVSVTPSGVRQRVKASYLKALK